MAKSLLERRRGCTISSSEDALKEESKTITVTRWEKVHKEGGRMIEERRERFDLSEQTWWERLDGARLEEEHWCGESGHEGGVVIGGSFSKKKSFSGREPSPQLEHFNSLMSRKSRRSHGSKTRICLQQRQEIFRGFSFSLAFSLVLGMDYLSFELASGFSV